MPVVPWLSVSQSLAAGLALAAGALLIAMALALLSADRRAAVEWADVDRAIDRLEQRDGPGSLPVRAGRSASGAAQPLRDTR